jgi:alkanesulfonate monooxygenase SsuD/methylene tetrahydromethanopterin reductase-like flavin-dependent oxidoreductase (luciferase family)
MRHDDTALLFDMRAPDFGAPAPELYREALAMAAFADEIGIGRIHLMEHHASEDGYLPAPFVMGGGVAARTSRARITLGAVILPLHDPVKIAEQIGVLDQMSGGRLEVIFGAGYVPSEFARFKVSLRDRGKLLDQGIEIIIRALKGERFEADGREVFVRPLPIQRPEDILLGGGGVEASVKRAARFGIGFAPLHSGLIPAYEEECRRLGRAPGKTLGSGFPFSIHLSEDPEAAWAKLWPHFAHLAGSYAKWQSESGSENFFKGMDNEEALRKSGMFAVWTPEELLARAPGMRAAKQDMNFMPLIAGLDPRLAWESVRLLADKVLPKLG